MNATTGIALAATLAIALGVPGTVGADPLQDCADFAADPADYSACLARRQREAMRRLEEARRAVAEFARDRGAPAQEAMGEAEAAFDRFVEAGCQERVRLGSQDAVADDLWRDCVIRLMEWRADELESVAEQLRAEGE